MQEKKGITALNSFDFGTDVNSDAVQTIRDSCNNVNITDEQQALIVAEHQAFTC
jgi:hypothetical protein